MSQITGRGPVDSPPGAQEPAKRDRPSVEVIAHRGYSGIAPENTLAAFEEAISWNVDGLEWDVRVSADSVPVVIHDETVDRTTDGSGLVGGMTFDELRRLDAGSWFAPEFRGERIPSLDEALAAAAGRVPQIYPEIKGIRGEADIPRILEPIDAHAFADACIIISLDWDILRWVRRSNPQIMIGFIVERRSRYHDALREAADDGRAILACDYTILLKEPRLVEEARVQGITLGVWTVNNVEDAERLIELGVTRLTTNEVARLLQHLGHGHAGRGPGP
ncbi:MAG: glycerophosphodiester phosphodiesterase [Gemmatimonadetes bacterium]|nr:glycerophosphodiester phosphodiesterase [Gemmatimonadota bacterium]